MNTITIAVIFVIFLGYLGFQFVKRFIHSNILSAFNKKDYKLAAQIIKMPSSRRFLGAHTCDLYLIKAYYLDIDEANFDAMLDYMLTKSYRNQDDYKGFLELYFHTFLIKRNKKYANILLAEINKNDDENFKKYNNQAYEVMINNRTDLIEEMDTQIDSKKYYGFSLGVILYMIAMQYESLGDIKNAISYFENAVVCLSPKERYCNLAKKHIKSLQLESKLKVEE